MKKLLLPILLLFALTNLSCSVYETFVNLSRLKFKLGGVNNFQLNGVSIANKSGINDFSALEILKISSAVAQGSLPVSFTVNVEAMNPNDGTGGYPKTNATLKSFPWRLFIDDKETISGNISSPAEVPGTGELTNIPIQLELDLVRFFKDQGYESLLNLALNLGGYGGTSSRITVFAKPIVSSALGDISYPEELKIVNFEFTK